MNSTRWLVACVLTVATASVIAVSAMAAPAAKTLVFCSDTTYPPMESLQGGKAAPADFLPDILQGFPDFPGLGGADHRLSGKHGDMSETAVDILFEEAPVHRKGGREGERLRMERPCEPPLRSFHRGSSAAFFATSSPFVPAPAWTW